MANTNADDSMGVAVEISIPGANENDILDIENDSDFPSPAEINVARFRPPSRPLEAYEAQLAGTPLSAGTIALMPLQFQFYGPPRRGHCHYIRQLRVRQPLPFPHFNHFF